MIKIVHISATNAAYESAQRHLISGQPVIILPMRVTIPLSPLPFSFFFPSLLLSPPLFLSFLFPFPSLTVPFLPFPFSSLALP